MADVDLSAPIIDGQVQTKPTADNTSKDRTGTGELGKEAFLQLLVAQMKYQDPLNPTSDTEYISQLATFSSLEEMQNINENLTSGLESLNTTMNDSHAQSLVGKYVMLTVTDEKGTVSATGGQVDYVYTEEGTTYLSVNGNDYPMSCLDSVVSEEYVKSLSGKGEGTANDLATASQLVGKNVTVMDDRKAEHVGEVTNVYMNNGYVYLTVDSDDYIDDYLYDNLVSVNRVVEEEKPDYLKLLTMDLKELKELFQIASGVELEEEIKESIQDAINNTGKTTKNDTPY
ncbi:MAG: hypothetical protein E7261_08770 [Lachnospiraceae bacterium]|nr:hypothetical protein [Lachnospiraceae bacterium]